MAATATFYHLDARNIRGDVRWQRQGHAERPEQYSDPASLWFSGWREASSISRADVVTGYNQRTDKFYLVGISSVYFENKNVIGGGQIDTVLYSNSAKTKIIAVLQDVNVKLTLEDFNITQMLPTAKVRSKMFR